MKNQLLLSLFLLISTIGNSQTKLRGTVSDPNGEPCFGAVVTVSKNGSIKAGSTVDLDGIYRFSSLEPGLYDIECSMIGTQKISLHNVKIIAEKTNFCDFILEEEVILLDACEIKEYKIPVVCVTQSNTWDLFDEPKLLVSSQSINGRNLLRFMLDMDIYSKPDFYVIEKSENLKNWSFLAKTYPLSDKTDLNDDRNDGMKMPIGYAPSQYVDDLSFSESDSLYYRVVGFKNPNSDESLGNTPLYYNIPFKDGYYYYALLKMQQLKSSTFRIQYAKTDVRDPILQISVKANYNAPAKLLITDMLGRIWVNQPIQLVADEIIMQQPIDQLIAGTYTVSIVEGASIETKKFVKM